MHYLADGAKHFPNEFAAIVGVTSKGRKGTSWNRVKDVPLLADQSYLEGRCKAGLSTGEGLIWAVRDSKSRSDSGDEAQSDDHEDLSSDEFITDKRLLIVEGEFARTLKAMGRESNTLSAILREAWDHGKLNILTKNQPATATNAHISLVVHIT